MAGANVHVEPPTLAEPFPPEVRFWTCPKTGLRVPKRVDENVEWRARLLRDAESDRGLQRDLLTASKLSVLFWVNAFVWTRRIFESRPGEKRRSNHTFVPFVTWWWIQDPHILAIERAIDEGHDLLTDKSRDMGATWDHVVVFDHKLLFEDNVLLGGMSRTEEDVDEAGNPKCLFSKFDDIHGEGLIGPTGAPGLPEWMLPNIRRTRLHIVNLDNGSRLDGSSSHSFALAGDRRHAIILDEFSKTDNAEQIKGNTADVTPCRLPNSTPNGMGRTYSKWRKSGDCEVFVLPWWEHPEKGAGRYVQFDPTTERHKIRSPYYDEEDKRRTRAEMAQDLDMDHVGSGKLFFDENELVRYRALVCRPPSCARTVRWDKRVPDAEVPALLSKKDRSRLVVKGRGKTRVWCELPEGRPDQTRSYVVGCDVSRGMGASNSILQVLCKETREVVLEFADANVRPHEFARLATAHALWVGGRSLPLMIWEMQGPGDDFGRTVVEDLGYPNFYLYEPEGTTRKRKRATYGWHANNKSKEVGYGRLSSQIETHRILIRSEETIEELATFVRYDNGGIGPAELQEESAEARKTHGDRGTGVMLCLVGEGDVPASKARAPQAPPNSFAGRRREAMRKKRNDAAGRTFDWR